MKNWTVRPTSIQGESLLQMLRSEPSGGGGMSFADRSVQMATEDAILCAAAPDLLGACELALKYLRPLSKDRFSTAAEATIVAAIAKAQGHN